MAAPILTTKLYIPAVRPELVPRPRLIERLNAGLRAACKLILISAPPGFGKTTLLSAWIYERMKDEFYSSFILQSRLAVVGRE